MKYLAILMLVLPVVQTAHADGYKQSEQAVGVQYYMATLCSAVIPGFQDKNKEILDGWRTANLELVQRFESDAKINDDIAARVAEIRREGMPRQGQEECENLALHMEETSEVKYERFATPERTWAAFVEALKAQDAKAALHCTTATARRKFKKIFKQITPLQMKRMGDAIETLNMAEGETGEFRTGIIVRKNKKAGIVTFLNVRGNWKISEL